MVGKELVGTSHREEDWRELIGRIRLVYSGPLTYSANWDGEYRRIRWWDALDVIGVSHYTPLAERDNPSDLEMHSKASAAADSLDRLSARWDRPYVLTEVGFVAHATAPLRPWESYPGGAGNLETQARCYEAILSVFSARERCRGTYWWKWFTDLPSNNEGSNRYDFPPYGKPAEKVLARWYERIERERSSAGPPG
jgi:hypothetical protein